MQTTKTIHLNPNGNLIKINGRVYRYYTRNLVVSLPTIFYAINHGATVHEVLPDGVTIQLTTQNYALDNQKAYLADAGKREDLEIKKRYESNIKKNMARDTGNAQNDISEQNELPEPIESDALRSDLDENSDDDDKNNQKKSNKRNSSKKSVEE